MEDFSLRLYRKFTAQVGRAGVNEFLTAAALNGKRALWRGGVFQRQIAIVAGAGVLIGTTMVVQADDLKKNYVKVDATIKEVTIDCYVKNSRAKIVEKDSDEIAYMDCAVAPLAAERWGYSKSDIHQRARVTYSYLSPVDKNFYRGEFVRTDDIEVYAKGVAISIFAHKEEAAKSKTPHGNVFLGDDNV